MTDLDIPTGPLPRCRVLSAWPWCDCTCSQCTRDPVGGTVEVTLAELAELRGGPRRIAALTAALRAAERRLSLAPTAKTRAALADDADTSTLALDLADAIDAVLPGLRATLEKP